MVCCSDGLKVDGLRPTANLSPAEETVAFGLEDQNAIRERIKNPKSQKKMKRSVWKTRTLSESKSQFEGETEAFGLEDQNAVREQIIRRR